MSLNKTTPTWLPPADGQTPLGEARSVVTLCLPDQLQESLPRHILAPAASVRHLQRVDLGAIDLVGPDAPDLILSPLTAPDFDVMEVAAALDKSQFKGRYLVLAAAEMPDIPLIRSELGNACKKLNIDVVALGKTSALHQV